MSARLLRVPTSKLVECCDACQEMFDVCHSATTTMYTSSMRIFWRVKVDALQSELKVNTFVPSKTALSTTAVCVCEATIEKSVTPHLPIYVAENMCKDNEAQDMNENSAELLESKLASKSCSSGTLRWANVLRDSCRRIDSESYRCDSNH